MSKQTDLPWAIIDQSPIDGISGIQELNLKSICHINGNTFKIVSELSMPADAAFIVQATNCHHDLVAALRQALRFIEVHHAYRGAMTVQQVEDAILNNQSTSCIQIGANSCNTLAEFDFNKARAALAKAQS